MKNLNDYGVSPLNLDESLAIEGGGGLWDYVVGKAADLLIDGLFYCAENAVDCYGDPTTGFVSGPKI